MADETLTVALICDCFPGPDPDDARRLSERLEEARSQGARLAILPELPLNPWSAATKTPRDDDAEPPEGPRHRMLAEAAARAGIGVVGGVIRLDADGKRRNTALVLDEAGRLAADYAKTHLPHEPGYCETCHYEPGRESLSSGSRCLSRFSSLPGPRATSRGANCRPP